MTEAECAWLAGWLEGEGTFYCHQEAPKKDTHAVYMRLTVRGVSTDEETIQRVQTITGGRVYGPYKRTSDKHQDYFVWSISGKAAAAEFMRMIRPLMGTRRQQQIDNALRRAET